MRRSLILASVVFGLTAPVAGCKSDAAPKEEGAQPAAGEAHACECGNTNPDGSCACGACDTAAGCTCAG